MLGGTVAYSGLTAASIGASVGVVTSAADSTDLAPLAGLAVVSQQAASSTSYLNRYEPQGRVQTLLGRASDLRLEHIPVEWRAPKIAHLAPIAREIDLALCQGFSDSFVGLTPQGLLREWDAQGLVAPRAWESCVDLLEAVDAVVLSIEDLQMDWQAAEGMAQHCRVLVVTTGKLGARFCSAGRWDERAGSAIEEVDVTGAGDIFAAVFFWLMQRSGDPAAAVEAANRVAGASVTRRGLAGVPTPQEVQAGLQPVGS